MGELSKRMLAIRFLSIKYETWLGRDQVYSQRVSIKPILLPTMAFAITSSDGSCGGKSFFE